MKRYIVFGVSFVILLFVAVFIFTSNQTAEARGQGFEELLKSEVTTSALACDNFGKTWDITVAPCSHAAPGRCVSGERDIDNTLGCSPVVVDGSYFGTVFSVTAYDNPNNTCVSTHWTGRFSPRSGTITGKVSNELGPFGDFTLTMGACSTTITGNAGDPALE